MLGKKFAFGVNYFSDEMWHSFDEKATEKDFALLSGAGIRYIRLLPVWKEFQPIKEQDRWAGKHFAVAYEDGTPLDNSPEGDAGVSPVMMNRLETVMNLCKKYGLKVELTLFCCAVNGQNTVPSYLENRNIFTDPTALMWEQKFIKYIVTRFKDHVSLSGFCIGEEYSAIKNINGNVAAQYSWTLMVCNAIRAIDDTHPVVSGLSSLATESMNPETASFWQLHFHAECVDMLTVHPKKVFGAYRNNTMRPILSSCAVNNMLEDIGEKPCFIEKTDFDGKNADCKADYVRGDLLSCYLHHCNGYFLSGELKEEAVFKEIKKTVTALSKIDMPKHNCDAVCVMPHNLQKGQRLATNVMCLSTQNDLGVSYCCAAKELSHGKLYIVPLAEENSTLSKNAVERLIDKARQGATVFVSVGSTFFKGLGVLADDELIARQDSTSTLCVNIDGTELPVVARYAYRLKNINGKVLASFSDGTPAIVLRKFGNGKIIISLFSVEAQVARLKGAFDRNDTPSYHKVYSLIMKSAGLKPSVYTDNIYVCAKEHKIDEKRSIISLMNYHDSEQKYTVGATFAYHVRKVLYGTLDGNLKNNDAVIFEIEKY